MGAQGTVMVDFGAFPGTPDTSITIPGQTGITGTSLVEAWIYPLATADHSVDEHRIENINVFADTIVVGSGFTVYAIYSNTLAETSTSEGLEGGTRLYGQWTVAWVWN